MKVRIIERTQLNGRVVYAIQQKHFLFRWMWVDPRMNSISGIIEHNVVFSTLQEAKKHLCYFDGSKPKEKVVTL